MLQSITYPAYLPPHTGVDSLTKTELEVFKKIDLPDKQIADILNVSYHTIRTHTQAIRKKTGFPDKKQMIKYATMKGYIN